MEIYKKIKKRRLELGLTLKDIANALNVAESTVSRYENSGIQNMGIDKIKALAKILKCSPAYLMGYDEPIEEISTLDLSNSDTILFEITPRSLINSPKIASAIIDTVEEKFRNVDSANITLYECLHYSQSYREKANILNSVIDYVLYNPITNNVDIVFLSVGQDTPERHADMMICPVELQPIVLQLESLNALGKAKIFENIKDLAYINKYKKYDKLGEGDE